MVGSSKTRPIIVIGAGICGVSTALWLQNDGHHVILIDKSKPGGGASYGNAGLLAQSAVVPIATPALIRAAPLMLIDPNSALFARWSYLPRMIPWLTKFLSNSRKMYADKIAQALLTLVTDAVEQHRALVRGTHIETWIKDSKLRYLYPSYRDYENDGYSWSLKCTAGFKPRIVTGPKIQQLEPIVGPNIKCMVELDGQGHINNPGEYVACLAHLFKSRGGRLITAEVKDFERHDEKIAKVLTTNGSFECSKIVITSGIGSKILTNRLGLSVPLEAERGYHVLFKSPSILPNHPMMAAGKFGITPMGDVLRCAGTVELGDTASGPSRAPISFIRKFVNNAFPMLQYTGTEEWLGFRPSTPDSLPLIGQIGKSGIYTCFGHQHIGLTAGPKSGRMITDLIAERHFNFDITPYSPNRFSI